MLILIKFYFIFLYFLFDLGNQYFIIPNLCNSIFSIRNTWYLHIKFTHTLYFKIQ